MVSRARVRLQSMRLQNLARSAANVVKRVERMDFSDMVEAVKDISEAYSTMSAAITAEYYNDIRKASKPKRRYTATAISGFEAPAALAAAQAIVNEYVAGNATVPLTQLMGDLVGRYINDAAEYCIVSNAKRDPAKPRYAIVPNGDACAFCIMRASNGYTYPDKVQGIKSHSHCTCQATPVFGSDKVEGYDVEGYRSQWEEADRAYRSGDIPDELKARIDAQKAAKGKDFDTTNAVLMVMREQQGIS